jgi:hypothetical protein
MIQPRILAATFALSLVVCPAPGIFAAAAATVRPNVTAGAILGSVWDASNTGVPDVMVRLRNVSTGRINATVHTNEAGQFTLQNIEGGNYVLEVLNSSGRVVAVGHPFAVAPGETIATFVRLGTKVPWFAGFFGNAATALSTAAASVGVTAIAPTGVAASPTQ